MTQGEALHDPSRRNRQAGLIPVIIGFWRMSSQPVDLSDSSLYLNREISWLKFNWRVLELMFKGFQTIGLEF